MRKKNVSLAFAVTAVVVTAMVTFLASSAASLHAQARYLFALDFHDPNLYVSTFTPDGILDYGNGGAAASWLRGTTFRISSSRWTATKRSEPRIGSTTPATTRSS